MSRETDARMLRHRHNGLIGSVAMAEAGMRSVERAGSTTREAKELAFEISKLLIRLETNLRMFRVDDGQVKRLEKKDG